jgi:hypothetical protein
MRAHDALVGGQDDAAAAELRAECLDDAGAQRVVPHAPARHRKHLAAKELVTDRLGPLPGKVLVRGEMRSLCNARHDGA